MAFPFACANILGNTVNGYNDDTQVNGYIDEWMVMDTDRAAAFANLGIVEDTQRRTPRITMLKKKGKRVLENADSIMTHLRAKFPAAEFETLEGKAIAVMSVKQQVSHFLSLTIMVIVTPAPEHYHTVQ